VCVKKGEVKGEKKTPEVLPETAGELSNPLVLFGTITTLGALLYLSSRKLNSKV
jgi:LPXTG-motif cell wall-anchored protein